MQKLLIVLILLSCSPINGNRIEKNNIEIIDFQCNQKSDNPVISNLDITYRLEERVYTNSHVIDWIPCAEVTFDMISYKDLYEANQIQDLEKGLKSKLKNSKDQIILVEGEFSASVIYFDDGVFVEASIID